MLVTEDRVFETTISTGAGAITLAGAAVGFRSFASVCSVGDTVYYMIEAVDVNGVPTGDWETGLGTYSAANTLTRTTVKRSSAANAAVAFAAGTKRVYNSAIASSLAAAGGGGAAATPTVRSSVIGAYSAASIAVPFPAGTIAGDLVIVFTTNGYNFVPTPPSGWTQFDIGPNGNYENGTAIGKVVTTSDVTTGSVTLTLSGSYDGNYAAVCITGSTFNGFRDKTSGLSGGSASVASLSVTGLITAQSTDLVIGFAGSRGNGAVAMSGFTALQAALAATNSSAFVGKYTGTLTKLGIGETLTMSGANNGVYFSVIAVR